MIIRRRSPIDGEWNAIDIDVRQDQIDAWNNGILIQNAMPNVSADHREFIMTGITPRQWETLF